MEKKANQQVTSKLANFYRIISKKGDLGIINQEKFYHRTSLNLRTRFCAYLDIKLQNISS